MVNGSGAEAAQEGDGRLVGGPEDVIVGGHMPPISDLQVVMVDDGYRSPILAYVLSPPVGDDG
jgi:hypothetical protein